MKTIIAGSREGCGYQDFHRALMACPFEITEVVSGGARGVDAMGETYAKDQGLPLSLFPADWRAHGKAAGPIRNREMAAYAEALVAIWDGESRGTKNMIDEASKRGLVIYVYRLDQQPTKEPCNEEQ